MTRMSMVAAYCHPVAIVVDLATADVVAESLSDNASSQSLVVIVVVRYSSGQPPGTLLSLHFWDPIHPRLRQRVYY